MLLRFNPHCGHGRLLCGHQVRQMSIPEGYHFFSPDRKTEEMLRDLCWVRPPIICYILYFNCCKKCCFKVKHWLLVTRPHSYTKKFSYKLINKLLASSGNKQTEQNYSKRLNLTWPGITVRFCLPLTTAVYYSDLYYNTSFSHTTWRYNKHIESHPMLCNNLYVQHVLLPMQ